MKCPKCGGDLKEGYELYPSYGGYNTRYWVNKLTPKKMLFSKPGVFGFEIDDGVKVMSKCCNSCGYLESYAK